MHKQLKSIFSKIEESKWKESAKEMGKGIALLLAIGSKVIA